MTEVYRVESGQLPDGAEERPGGILRGYGLTFAEFWREKMEVEGGWVENWAIIYFPEELPVAGHVASVRKLKMRMPVTYYSRGPVFVAGNELSVRPISTVFVPSKAVLADVAPKSPLLAPAWEALKEKDAAEHWICIADSPDPEWVARISEGDSRRYVAARALERKLLAVPGYESLHENPDYSSFTFACGEGDSFGRRHYIERLVDKYPRRPYVYWLRGDTIHAEGDYEAALEDYRKAVELFREGAMKERDKWLARWKDRRDEDSLEKDVAAIRFDKVFEESASAATWSWINIAGIHHDAGRLEAGISAARASLDTRSGDRRGLWLLGTYCEEKGDQEAAVNYWMEASQYEPWQPQPWIRLASIYAKNQRPQEAVWCLLKGTEADPENYVLWEKLASTYADQGDYEKAVECCRKVLAICPDCPWNWNMVGYCYAHLGEGEAAIDAGRKAVALGPDANSWDTLGVAYSVAGRQEQAVKCFLRAIEMDWEHAEAWHNLGVAYVRSGKREKAAEVRRQLGRLDLAWAGMGAG